MIVALFVHSSNCLTTNILPPLLDSEEGKIAVASLGVQSWNNARRDDLHRAIALWLVKSARPLTLPERDEGFRRVMERATGGGYSPPSYKTVKQVSHPTNPHESFICVNARPLARACSPSSCCHTFSELATVWPYQISLTPHIIAPPHSLNAARVVLVW